MKPRMITFLTIAVIAVCLLGAISVSKLSEDAEPELADFEISIQKTEDGVKLTCTKGCAWKELSYSRSDGNYVQSIDQNGMLPLP